MYVPPAFAVEDRAWTLGLIARYPFGMLVTCEGEDPRVTHLPMLARECDGELRVLGHVARANPHALAILRGDAATAIFTGAHAYVSASWYEEPYATVPTWNYEAAYLRGRLRECDARGVVAELTAVSEAGRPEPWQFERLAPEFAENQLRGIVAFELAVESIEAKAKLSQNRTQADQSRVIESLLRSPHPIERDCADAMRGIASKKRMRAGE